MVSKEGLNHWISSQARSFGEIPLNLFRQVKRYQAETIGAVLVGGVATAAIVLSQPEVREKLSLTEQPDSSVGITVRVLDTPNTEVPSTVQNANSEIPSNVKAFVESMREYAALRYLIPKTITYMENTGDPGIIERAQKIRELLDGGKIRVQTPADKLPAEEGGNLFVNFGPDGENFSVLLIVPADWDLRVDLDWPERAFLLTAASFVYDDLARYSPQEWIELKGDKKSIAKFWDSARARTNRLFATVVDQIKRPDLRRGIQELKSSRPDEQDLSAIK